jgi:hypothetical protein
VALHLVGDLARSGSKPGELGPSDPARVPDVTAAAQQIVGKPDSHAFGRSRAALAAWPLILPVGRGSQPGWRSTLSAIWRAALLRLRQKQSGVGRMAFDSARRA